MEQIATLPLPDTGILLTVLGRIQRLFGDTDFLMRFGPDTAFLCATLAVITESGYLKNQVSKLILQPVLNTLPSNPEYVHDMAIMLSNTLLLLNQPELINEKCRLFVQLNEYDHETYLVLQETEGYSYRDLLSGTVTTYFQSWAFTRSSTLRKMWPSDIPLVTPDEIVSQALDIAYSHWYDMTTPLQFQPNKVLRQTDTNREKIYFLTHVVFLSNHYGTQPLNPKTFPEPEQNDIYTVLLTWFLELVEKGAVYANLEEASEIACCLLFLNRNLGYQTPIPLDLCHLVEELTRRADKLTVRKTGKHAWYPKDNSEYDIYTDAHSLLVVSLLLAEMTRYQSYRSLTHELTSGWSDPGSLDLNSLHRQLLRNGYVFVPAQHQSRRDEWSGLDTVTRQLIQVVRKQEIKDILLRVPPKPEGVDIFLPHPPTTHSKLLKKIHLPNKFWSKMQRILAQVLGLPLRRIIVLTEETYIRLKTGSKASTNAHSDLFYFLRETDVISRIYPGLEVSPLQRGICQICRSEKGETFSHSTIGPDCVQGYLPVYTAWLSLGDFQQHEHSLIEVVPKSHLFPGYDTAIKSAAAMTKGLLPLIKIPESDWCYPSENGVRRCDLLIFNCKTIHRAKPAKTNGKTPRMSVDMRFIISPDTSGFNLGI
jgi:hypothetical protein